MTKKKLPWMKFYPGDWLKDPALSMCSPATRGIWIDALAAMHENGRAGELSGTPEMLARALRCEIEDVTICHEELTLTKTAEVTVQNGVITLRNRRMLREAKAYKLNALRQKRWRRNAKVTDVSREKNAEVTGGVTPLLLTDVRSQKSEVRIRKSTAPAKAGTVPGAPNLPEPVSEPVKVNADFSRLVEVWHDAFRAQFDSDYAMKGGRDGKAVNALLKRMDPEGVMRVATRAWGLSGFLGQRASTLHGLNESWNEIVAELKKRANGNGGRPGAPLPASQEPKAEFVSGFDEIGGGWLLRKIRAERAAREAQEREAQEREGTEVNETTETKGTE
jgi:hypothetical protein